MSTSTDVHRGAATARSAGSSRRSGAVAAAALAALDVDRLDVTGVEHAMALVALVRNWASAVESRLVMRSDSLAEEGRGAGGRETSRSSGRRSSGSAGKASARAAAVKSNPSLGDDLADGATTEDHLDGLAGAARDLDEDLRNDLFNDPEIEDAARRMPPEPFRKFAKKKADRLAADEGEDRLAKQKAATKLRTWVRNDGMHIINGEFDPETGSRVFRALEAEVDTKAARDHAARNDHTRAHALAALVERGLGAGPNATPPEVLVIDAATLASGVHDGSVCETESGAFLPPESIRRAMCESIVLPTVIRGADGQVLSTGRVQRVANRAQRRALRAMYPTCAFDGCQVGFTACQIHHIIPWAVGGRTDLDNLVPLCGRHHHLVHEGRWRVRLEPDRTLVIHEPSGRHFKDVPLPSKDLAAHLIQRHRGDPGPPGPGAGSDSESGAGQTRSRCRPAHN